MVTSRQELTDSFLKAQEATVLEVADQGLLTLSSLVQSGAIDVSPSFQRRDRWNPERQSLLIESFLTNIPVPPVYLAEDRAHLGTYAVIDGKQRLTAISSFFADDLVLKGLGRLEGLNGLKYSKLPQALRNALGMKSLRVTTLLRQSDQELKHEVFLRLNTGGEVLNAQEIRNVAYRGPLNDLIYNLAKSTFLRSQFKATPPTSPAYRKMVDAELVLRFITLSVRWREFRGDLRSELDRFMWSGQFLSTSGLDQLERSFNLCIDTAEKIWGTTAFKRPGRDQALAGMYDAEMIALSEIPPNRHLTLVKNRLAARKAVRALFSDGAFEEAVRVGTNTPARLAYRTSQVLDVLRAHS